ncbi:MAG: tRNA pseudouridine(55) synthase TruB [Actinobacteria bacterium]|nr:tRNA pseudouridine(55) synthase TruB [Actinomycetota bacterium]
MDGILVIDKPSGPTSHDIVNIVRRVAGLRRVGHTGTLDPMATGVMVLLLGRATRIGRFLDLDPKGYIAEAIFGIVTDTQDITGRTVRESAKNVNIDDIKRLIPNFTGDIWQVPPMVSAVKIRGRPLYKLARQGREVERPGRLVTIYELELVDFFESDGKHKAIFRIVCSGGTYIRTLIHDLGEKLGTGATLSSLTRTKVGRFTLSDAVSIDIIKATGDDIHHLLISMDSALSHFPEVIVKDEAVALVLNGQKLETDMLERYLELGAGKKFLRIKSRSGNLLALGQIVKTDHVVITPKVVFN